jgi:hypothetical protein
LQEAGNYYFEKGDYTKALEYFEKVSPDDLNNYELTAWKFKKGYAHFVKKQWEKARPLFKEVKNIKQSDYFYPSNYYYALSSFFSHDYNEALAGFHVAKESPQYQSVVGTELEFVIMVIAVSCVKLLSAHNSTQHTSRKHKV